jgi:prepilin-type N-terminal cleavage/methylation domain-containing protein
MSFTLRIRRQLPSNEAGFGMIELLIAMSIMSIGILAVFALFQTGMVTIRRASTVSTAAALADSEMERYRALKFTVIGLDDAEVAAAGAVYLADTAYKAETTPSTTLSSTIDAAATTFTVASGVGFPGTKQPFRIKIGDEVLEVTDVTLSGSVYTFTVVRGVDGTVAASHSAGAAVIQKQRAHVVSCGSGTCTNAEPVKTVTGADARSYRVDTYVTWQVLASGGFAGRNAKLVTIVVRNPTSPTTVYARVSSSFDLATGL